ncbi:cytochrome oxidase subunit VII [Trypanosoma equiperdum]|uniref:Cytochrome c oxidase VII, putative n=4 Tax=Trypanozoon TaxID=39700 RepID=Q57XX4_TRYB2|nr:cytochrome c oxidase VII, putative [Trypanosoma brucei gambiense DAL972]XP_843735.1 cytochrome c oxidase VII, putative [Trypanosoma brucei brucei TREU927]AAX69545.1 cytochrome c oxidase VII, putative [Trypanosoma brucei]RHW73783.1 cytochrome oxidase subunit VII [Trypanosoma brucei equiperdum]SCU69914.1 cytochrome oxidase subunit VII [Trypanosoma equiperdum]AAZ10176.1 cytochrome c oxidase VII, putative [Trypanosoma brucei brucei TREU927]CBH09777.1 cytochrome c oxidase VII, putative [Trypano|eukprot:XP_011772070.1 cytochrome c oxidase VII, putative [Trypanosoma brucei gambiense DAL972]
MPRPFGVWAPATTLAEYRARIPGMSNFKLRWVFGARREVYYHPEALAHFKDHQQYKDAVDTVRAMRTSDKFFGEGVKLPHHPLIKMGVILSIHGYLTYCCLRYYYGTHVPANNPTWRKIVNKEWEEAINNSPWDHMSHVWQYSDQYASSIGEAAALGRRKFYIPA